MPRIPLAAAPLLLLAGCAAIGGAAGHARDAERTRTRVVPAGEYASIPIGTLVFATIPERETLRGRFEGIDDSAGAKILRVETSGRHFGVPMDRVTELVEEAHGHRFMWTGIWIGASIDVFLLGSSLWLYTEIRDRSIE